MRFMSRLSRFRSPSPVPCQQVVEMVTDYVEGVMPGADRRRLEHHLGGCRYCTAYLAQIRETIRLAGRVTPDDLTPPMRTELTDLYRRWRTEG